MKPQFPMLLLVFFLCLAACKTSKPGFSGRKDDGKLEVVFVQVNDVYEIAPLEGGKSGGIARLATIKKDYKKINQNTLLVIAGDFVSPSVFNSLQYNGKRIRGKQMIDAMNSAGMDLAIFGNHEFDISENELQERINESNFQWVSSNSFHMQQGMVKPFVKLHNNLTTAIPKTLVMNFRDADGTTAKIGFIGLTLPFNKAPFVSYTNPLEAAKTLYASIKDSCDAVVAITHQSIEDDIILAKEIPGLALIIGGHEHDMRFNKTGNIYITKAHANARSVYIDKLLIDKKNKSTKVTPQLKMLDETVPLDSATSVVVKKWMDIGDENYTSLGFDAKQVVITGGDTLEGRETEIRKGITNLTKLVAASIADACPDADVVMFNAGSIRVDDRLAPPITEYDIIRALPFGGGTVLTDMKGKLLLRVLQSGIKNAGNGGFLQYQPVIYNSYSNTFTINGTAIDPEKVYKVALSDFLLSGQEKNLDFLTKDNPDVIKVYPEENLPGSSQSDIRLAVVRYLQKNKK
jgi:5'-nucleotidase